MLVFTSAFVHTHRQFHCLSVGTEATAGRGGVVTAGGDGKNDAHDHNHDPDDGVWEVPP